MRFKNSELYRISKVFLLNLFDQKLINQTELENCLADLRKIYNIQEVAFE